MRRPPPSGDGPPSKPPGPKRIGVPDEMLWQAVARTVEPLRRQGRKGRIRKEGGANGRDIAGDAAGGAPGTGGGDAGGAVRTGARRERGSEGAEPDAAGARSTGTGTGVGAAARVGAGATAARRAGGVAGAGAVAVAGPGRRPKAGHIGDATAKPSAAKAVAPAHVVPPLAGFDRRRVRRLAAGQIEVEARLDLHGLRQSEAHYRLVSFIRDCVARGLSTVLVITGKGGRRESGADAPFDDLDARDHGVLRRSVPHWLAHPELRGLVVSQAPAGPRHGGSGALYVHLRRRTRVGGW